MVNIGKSSRRVTLKNYTTEADSGGFETESVASETSVWAQVVEERGSEVFKSGRELGSRFVTIRIRPLRTFSVTQQTRITYDSVEWDVESLRTVDSNTKRRDYLEIFARAHD